MSVGPTVEKKGFLEREVGKFPYGPALLSPEKYFKIQILNLLIDLSSIVSLISFANLGLDAYTVYDLKDKLDSLTY